MHPFIEGLYFGLILCFLLGPIFFALIQAGIEQGFRAGVMIGFGVWVSDFLFIIAVYWGVSYIMAITAWEGFTLTLGITGGIILVAVGLGTLLTSPPDIQTSKNVLQKSTVSYLALWMKGFLINTINPFTFFFWVSVSTTVVIKDGFDKADAISFFSGILLMIILTDILKVVLAKVIRKYLKQSHVIWMRRITGGALLLFGIALMVRVILFDT
ncbi:MAG: LysE family translocator [Bacteroidota bacterium]